MPATAVSVFSTRLAKATLEEIAHALGRDVTTACKVRSGERAVSLIEFARLIPILGLKLVDAKKVCVDPEAYRSMSYMAGKAMANAKIAQELTWEEET